MMPNLPHYLICTDYDKTIGDTFNQSPNKIGVHEAYEFAIGLIFGEEGLRAYKQIGGLQNRAPGELVEDLLKNGNKNLLVKNARLFFKSRSYWLKNLASHGKFVIPEWNNTSQDRDIRDAISEMIILLKLFHLMKEIGTTLPNGKLWPEPCKGILDFFRTIKDINRSKEASVQLAILSSGHTEFVKKTFKIWGEECPEILITDDDVRRLPIDLKDKIKPSKFLFYLIYEEWLKKRGIKIKVSEIAEEDLPRIIYIGDDAIKDGKLAQMTGVLFGWFNPEKFETDKKNAGNIGFSFSDWKIIATILKQKETIKFLQKGEPLAKIFSPLIK